MQSNNLKPKASALLMQVVTWVPQNDILAHPNLRAFLSHVGLNSMYEVLVQNELRSVHKGSIMPCRTSFTSLLLKVQ